MIAKIAHCYTVYRFGLDAFVPYLPHLIFGDHDDLRHYYIGGSNNTKLNSDTHTISVKKTDSNDNNIIVSVQLFSMYNMPVYEVLSGKLLTKSGKYNSFDDNAHITGPISSMWQRIAPVPQGFWNWKCVPIGSNRNLYLRVVFAPDRPPLLT